jgi:hypothetical protein
MPEQPEIFTVQPRFKIGDYPTGWALVDGIFRFGDIVPAYGTEYRDAALAVAWFGEPMIAGVFSTWIEKAQTINWKVTGGRNSANHYARLFNNADNGAGWTYHEGVTGLDYLTTDKGSFEELGRDSLTDEMVQTLQSIYERIRINQSSDADLSTLNSIINQATTGKVVDIQHLDSTRLIRIGLPGMRWRYYPDNRYPVALPDLNIIQITSMPSARDRWQGFGHCALTRLLDAKQLMLGYLTYYRQEIGNLPPELVAIINGLPETTVRDSLANYKREKDNKGLDTYGKIWWLGSDDPMTPVSLNITSLTSPNKAFQYQTMIEWWAKLLALNTGEDVGEYWLLQSGESKTVQSIQAMKSEGKGVARYIAEKERKYNTEILPYGTLFEYDNPYDEADRTRADILARNVGTLQVMASIGVDRQDPAYTTEEIRRLGVEWDITPLDFNSDDAPAVFGAVLKSLYDEDTWVVDRQLQEKQLKPLLSGKEARQAEFVHKALKEVYTVNGHMKHKSILEHEPAL